MGHSSEGQGQEGGARRVPQGAVKCRRTGWADSSLAPHGRTPTPGNRELSWGPVRVTGQSLWCLGGEGGGEERTQWRGKPGCMASREQENFQGELIPKIPPSNYGSAVGGGWGRQSAKSGREEVETLLPPWPWPPHPRQAQGQLTSSLQPPGATRVTPTPAPLCALTTSATSLGWDGHGILSKTFPLQNNPSKYVFGNGLLI